MRILYEKTFYEWICGTLEITINDHYLYGTFRTACDAQRLVYFIYSSLIPLQQVPIIRWIDPFMKEENFSVEEINTFVSALMEFAAQKATEVLDTMC